MIGIMHRTASGLFYAFGITYFVAYLLWRNEIGDPWPQFWMSVADLPFALVALLYGGLSLYRSLKQTEKESILLGIAIAIPLVAVFAFLCVLNYWELLIGS